MNKILIILSTILFIFVSIECNAQQDTSMIRYTFIEIDQQDSVYMTVHTFNKELTDAEVFMYTKMYSGTLVNKPKFTRMFKTE